MIIRFSCGSSGVQLEQHPGTTHCYDHGMIPSLRAAGKVMVVSHLAGGRNTEARGEGESAGSQTTDEYVAAPTLGNSQMTLCEALHPCDA